MPEKIDKLLERIASADLADLMSIWQAREPERWPQRPEVYGALGERILAQGEPLLAFDVVREGLSILPANVRLRQLQGLALARSGASERANEVLEELRREGQADEETLGMLGRTYKDLAAARADPRGAREIFEARRRNLRARLCSDRGLLDWNQCGHDDFALR